MKIIALLIISVLTILMAEDVNSFEFNPSLLIQTDISQQLKSDGETGDISLYTVEPGFGVSYNKNLFAYALLGINFDDISQPSAFLREAYGEYAINDYLSLKAGQMILDFGDGGGEAPLDPLIYGSTETVAPGVNVALNYKVLYGSISAYQGILSNNLKAMIASIGLNLDDKFNFKLSSRMEILDSTYVDLSVVTIINPIDLISIHLELYGETVAKNSAKALGYYGELAFYPIERLTAYGRFGQYFSNTKVKDSEFNIQIQGGAAFNVYGPFSTSATLVLDNSSVGTTSEWIPTGIIRFQIEI